MLKSFISNNLQQPVEDNSSVQRTASVAADDSTENLGGGDNDQDNVKQAFKGMDNDNNTGSDDTDSDDDDNDDHLAVAVVPQRKSDKVFNLRPFRLILDRTNVKKFQCKNCQKYFASEDCLNKHITRCFNVPGRCSRNKVCLINLFFKLLIADFKLN